jgi:tetratricopeptide (TPR) repeat protein
LRHIQVELTPRQSTAVLQFWYLCRPSKWSYRAILDGDSSVFTSFFHRPLVVSTICSFCLLTACGRSTEQYVTKGESALAAGHLDEAGLNFRKALQMDARSASANYGLARVERKLGNTGAAWQHVQETIRLNASHTDARMMLGELALGGYVYDPGRSEALYKAVETTAESLVKARPGAAWRLRGQLALVSGQHDRAAAMFRQSLDADPREDASAVGLAEALLQAGRVAEAESLLRQISHTDPSGKAAGFITELMLRFHTARNDIARAERVLRQRMEIVPADARPVAELAGLLHRAGRKTEAEAVISTITDHPERYSDGLLIAGKFFSAAGDGDRAVGLWRAGLQAADSARAEDFAVPIASLLRQRGDYASAIRTLEEAAGKNPRSLGIRTMRIELLVERNAAGDSRAAVAAASALAAERAGDPQVRYLYGRSLQAAGDGAGARRELAAAAEKAPRWAAPKIALAETAMLDGDAVHALKWSDDALKAQPDSPQAKLARSAVLIRTGAISEARDMLNTLLRDKPGLDEAILQLAEIDAKSNPDAAIRTLRKLYRPGASTFRIVRALAVAEMELGRPGAALDLLQAEAGRMPSEAALLIAEAAEAAKRLDAGEALLSKMVSVQPSAAANAALVRIHRARGDSGAALRALDAVRKCDPAYAGLDAIAGSVYEEMRDWPRALAAYNRALALQPGSAVLRNNIAFLLLETGANPDEALRVLAPVRKNMGDDPVLNDTLAAVYLRKGQPDLAIEILEPLTGKYATHADIHYHLGMAWLAKGRPAEAKRHLEKAGSLKTPARTAALIREGLKQAVGEHRNGKS